MCLNLQSTYLPQRKQQVSWKYQQISAQLHQVTPPQHITLRSHWRLAKESQISYDSFTFTHYTLTVILIHLVVCLTTGPKPLPKRALHSVT